MKLYFFFFALRHFIWFLDIRFHILSKIELTKNISETSEFPILVMEPNQKLANLENLRLFLSKYKVFSS